MEERRIWARGARYMEPDTMVRCTILWNYQQQVGTRHHMRRFLHRSLVLKMYLKAVQTPDTMAECKKKNMAKFEGGGLLTETLKFFSKSADIPWWTMNTTHFCLSQSSRKLQ